MRPSRMRTFRLMILSVSSRSLFSYDRVSGFCTDLDAAFFARLSFRDIGIMASLSAA